MRLAWKIFFLTIPVFLLSLTLLGTWILQESFQSNLDRERERCFMENQMFQVSYELTWHSASLQSQEDSVKAIAESIRRNAGSEAGNTRIYGADGAEVLYQDTQERVENGILESLTESVNVGAQIAAQGNRYYIVVLSRSGTGVYIETVRDLTPIFKERDERQSVYQTGVFLITFIMGGLMLGILYLVMGNTRKLSRTVRSFATGQYDVRANIRSRDEIGRLAADFNWMAGIMNAQMEQLKEEVSRQEAFTSAFAHELKTPLTSIIGYADTIRSMELSKEENDMSADYIYRQGKRLLSLSYKLLEWSAMEGKEPNFKRILFPELIREVSEIVAPAMEAKNLSLIADVKPGFVYGDRELLGSVFINLLDNAAKASQPGKRIWITGYPEEGFYLASVQDEGMGVKKEELSRLTEAFYMVDKSRSRKEGGAGLGLALCKKILDLHKAAWQMESEPGEGMKITVLFRIPKRKRNSRSEQS
ncbi:MAG TPA: HAMP domain-containing protein [Candidatus Choladousia intestinigallinarum]|nr:HAMP domain-containing protein [Candidatus Choladousia intestinigallinarum]